METKHTKGEWKVDFTRKVNETEFALETSDKISYEEAKANAKLIAAAPELLEALQRLVLETSHALPNSSGMQKAISAIKKATS